MSSGESDNINSIIPEIALSAALSGREERLIRKRKKFADDENIIESSPEKEGSLSYKKKSSNSNQVSIENYLPQYIGSGEWIPVHKKPTNTERKIRKKVISIDEDEGPKSGPVSAVVQEGNFDGEDMNETVKLSKNIEKARRKSIVNYLPQVKNKDKSKITLKNFMSHERKISTGGSLMLDLSEDDKVKEAAELYTEVATHQSTVNVNTKYHQTIEVEELSTTNILEKSTSPFRLIFI